MADLAQLIAARTTRNDIAAQSRKATLDTASDLLAEVYPEISARHLFDELMARERLGSTGLGDGVAIPHCRLQCERMYACCLKLATAVDFEAPDGAPVDLVFVLVVPQDETSAHLEVLAQLAALLGDAENRAQLRACASDNELHERLLGLIHGLAA